MQLSSCLSFFSSFWENELNSIQKVFDGKVRNFSPTKISSFTVRTCRAHSRQIRLCRSTYFQKWFFQQKWGSYPFPAKLKTTWLPSWRLYEQKSANIIPSQRNIQKNVQCVFLPRWHCSIPKTVFFLQMWKKPQSSQTLRWAVVALSPCQLRQLTRYVRLVVWVVLFWLR